MSKLTAVETAPVHIYVEALLHESRERIVYRDAQGRMVVRWHGKYWIVSYYKQWTLWLHYEEVTQ